MKKGSVGGFGSFVLQHLSEAGALDQGLRVRTMVLPDVQKQYDEAGLNAQHIVAKVLDSLGAESNKYHYRSI